MQYTFQFGEIWKSLELLGWGALLTIQLSGAAMILGIVVSVVCAYARLFAPLPVRLVVDAYVEVIRNTPFLVQIFLVFFGLPSLGVRLGPNSAALIAMVLNVGAYGTEIVRAGIESISKGQVEAGRSIGLTRFQLFRLVILPPALQTVYPALTSQFILLLLGSSVISAISAEELTAIANDIQSRTFRTVEVYLVVLVIYLVISSAFSYLFWVIEKMAFMPRALRAGNRR